MSTQHALALPAPAPSNTVVINARRSLRVEGDQRVIVVAGLPVHHYRAADAVAEIYAMLLLVESGFAQQTDVARAFGRSVRTIRRYQERYEDGGTPALARERGWRRGRRRISSEDPTRTIPNPERRALDKEIRAARVYLANLEREFGAAAANNAEHRRPTMRGFKIAHGKLGKQLRKARAHLSGLINQRRDAPKRVQVRELNDRTLVKLATERKHLTDIIKMVA